MIDQGCANAPDDTANNNTADAPSGPSRCRATSMPNTWAHTQTLNRAPNAMPMAARLHSAGRVLMAAGNQRASIEKGPETGGEKKACLVSLESLERSNVIGGGKRAVCQLGYSDANAY
ncbi:hypothetical protein [Pseudomonas sp. 34 E 7]|nr:hypothetical protein [Pseudomonas sp. 34 E 7]